MAKVVGIGGVFLKAENPKGLSEWYAKHLGLTRGDDGSTVFEVADAAGMTVFSHFAANTAYFGDGPQQAMVNFRVDDLDALLAQLSAEGVWIDPKREEYSYGQFAWIRDPEGNRVELWQVPAE